MKHLLHMLVFAGLVLLVAGCDKKADPEQPTERSVDGSESAREATLRDDDQRRASDVHTHISPFAYEMTVKLMDQNGLRRIVNMSGGSRPEDRRRHVEVADEYNQRVALFSNIAWQRVDEEGFGEAMADELAEAVEVGFAGLKISKALGLGVETDDGELLAVDDRRLDPIWDRAGELGIPVGIHTGDPKAFFEEPNPDNERWDELKLAPSWSFHGEEYPSREALLAARDRVVARHPDTTFMLLHFANNPEDIDYVDRLLDKHPNVVVDIAARIAEIGRHDPDKVRKIFEKHQDRILFATDLGIRARRSAHAQQYSFTLGSISKEPPTPDDVKDFYQDHWRFFETDAEAIDHPVPIQGDWKVHPIALSDEVLDKLYFENAERIIFAPWLARRTAGRIVDTARERLRD